MRLLSIAPILLVLGCALHLGVIPAEGRFVVLDVRAPVAEHDIDAWVRESVLVALAARRAFDPAGVPVRVTVTEAAWEPSRRSGATLLYQARLVLRIEAGSPDAPRVGTQSRALFVVDPGTAGGARTLRESTFRALARAAAEDAVAWLVVAPG